MKRTLSILLAVVLVVCGTVSAVHAESGNPYGMTDDEYAQLLAGEHGENDDISPYSSLITAKQLLISKVNGSLTVAALTAGGSNTITSGFTYVKVQKQRLSGEYMDMGGDQFIYSSMSQTTYQKSFSSFEKNQYYRAVCEHYVVVVDILGREFSERQQNQTGRYYYS